MRSFLSIAMAGALLVVGTVFADETTNTEQDISNIKQLQRIGEPYDGIAEYQKYLASHPLTPAQFSQKPRLFSQKPRLFSQTRSAARRQISVLVDAALINDIQTGLDNYVEDLAIDGYDVFVDTVSGGTPQEIKAWIASRHAQGSEGVLLVGDITTAWAEVDGSVFPCDLYYMDLDGAWTDADKDGDFESHVAGNGDQGPEVYVTRLYTHSLNWDTEPNMLNHYFQKTRAYRDGDLKQPWRGLEYIDNDWASMYVALDKIYGENIDRVDKCHVTTAPHYLEQMSKGYHFVQVCAHGGARDQFFNGNPDAWTAFIHTYVYSPTERTINLYARTSTDANVILNGTSLAWFWDRDRTIPLELNQGWNRLMCRVIGDEMPFTLTANIKEQSAGSTRGLMNDEALVDDLIFSFDDPLANAPEPRPLRNFLVLNNLTDPNLDYSQLLAENFLGVDESLIQPQDNDQMAGHTWVSRTSTEDFFDAGFAQWTESVAYAYATICSNTTKDCQFLLGYDDGASVWLNGENILFDNRQGDGSLQTATVPVTLTQGTNHLVIKLTQWTGQNGFIARFANYDGTGIGGVWNSLPQPQSHCPFKWLTNGVYTADYRYNLLYDDFLNGVRTIRPNTGDSAPTGIWEQISQADSTGIIDLGQKYDVGSTVVKPADIHAADPPVLFSNHFTCGAGYFLDENYIPGTHIFDSTWGLGAIASAKTGSMLNFHCFTVPLSNARTLGQAFMDWFDAQSPFDEFGKGWFYGMIVQGDPTLMLYTRGDANCDGVVDYLDIDPFVVSLVDREAYETQYPNCNNLMADANRDGVIDVFDIDPFIEMLLENTTE